MPKILVTSALPYANGSIHLGHMLEQIQTDIYVRSLRSMGRDAVYICADDTHGTPIEIASAKQGVAPEDFIGKIAAEHKKDFADFGIRHDYYGSTHTDENRKYSELIFQRLTEKGYVEKREIKQFYCEKDKRFLPDRFIKGTCPFCKTPDQYGDVCEKCGHTYAPADLIEPRCAICGTPPVLRSSTHYMVQLGKFTEFLRQHVDGKFVDPVVRNSLEQWFKDGLSDWDISRDGPYFGFKIPGESDKYFYVWLDAPIGYLSNTERWLKEQKRGDALVYWAPDADAEIVHVIGKDIVYFHTLFWPAMLKAADFKLPKRVVVHGMLTLNGEKMSKTRGTFINARDYLNKLDPMYLRYFFAANLGPTPEDIDLSLDEFRNRVNADLVNNFGNLANRSLKLLSSSFDGKLSAQREPEGFPLSHAQKLAAQAAKHFEALEIRDAVRVLKELGDWANKYLADHAPWNAIKGTDAQKNEAHRDLSFAAEVAYRLGALLEPIVPNFSEALFKQLNAKPLTIRETIDARGPLLPADHRIGTPAPLAPRLEAKLVDALIQVPVESAPAKTEANKAEKKEAKAAPSDTPPASIPYDDFAKLDLRVGKVLACEKVQNADKLLMLTVDLGEAAPRTIVSGIAAFYQPAELVGRQIVVVANLAPREFKKQKLTSHGMVLSASITQNGVERLKVVEVPADIPPGAQVR